MQNSLHWTDPTIDDSSNTWQTTAAILELDWRQQQCLNLTDDSSNAWAWLKTAAILELDWRQQHCLSLSENSSNTWAWLTTAALLELDWRQQQCLNLTDDSSNTWAWLTWHKNKILTEWQKAEHLVNLWKIVQSHNCCIVIPCSGLV